MKAFFISTEQKGIEKYQIHQEGCEFLPNFNERIYLGIFKKCDEALDEAKKVSENLKVCPFCSKECE